MRSKGLTASALVVAVLFVLTMTTPSWAADIPCAGPIGAVEIKGNISAGAGCDLSGATVRGNVSVNPGGNLTTEAGSTTVITGNVQSSNATMVFLRGATSVGGNVRLADTRKNNDVLEGTVTGNVEIDEGGTESLVFGETVGGNVKMLNASLPAFIGEVAIASSSVGGNVEIGNNSLKSPFGNFVVVSHTTVAGNLRVYTNSSPPVREGRETINSLSVDFNQVGGNAELLNNTGFSKEISVEGNTVTNNLVCIGNVLPPKGTANTAKKKLGQCELL
jgi:hypothetical protein